MSEDKMFYELVDEFHRSLSPSQKTDVEAFMGRFEALDYYREMVDPKDPSADPEKRNEEAVAQAITIFQLVPKGELAKLEEVVGEEGKAKFDQAAELVKKRFGFLARLFG